MNIARVAKKGVENETFWQGHIAAQSSSQLSKLAYCRENHIDYARFHYWLKRKEKAIVKKPLIAVQLAALPDEAMPSVPLCTLVLPKGLHLRIHDAHALMLVLDRMS